ncbi:NAV1 protein, partial [Atractosteus spatula]|nr:NAV1 protein [Atractosteus spatula]
MSGSVNLKIAPRTQQGSGIPLPRSLITSSKPVDKNQGTGGTRRTTQLPVSAKGTTSSKELLRGSTLRSWERNQLLFQNTGMSRACSSSKASYASERDNGTRSAFSSPRISRKEAPRSKDTLDVNKSSLAFDAFRDQKQNRNKVTQQGNSGFRQNANEDLRENKSCTREDSALSPCTAKERVPATFSNDNSLPNLTPTRTSSIRTDKGHLDFSVPGGLGSFSDEEMGTPEDSSPTKQELPVSPSVSVQGDSAILLPKGKQPSQVNMAAVAPFRYRLQIEDNDVSSLEDFSDCSSDSMELSCQSMGGMLGASVKGNEVDIKTDLEESAKAYVQPEGKGTSMASKRGKTGAPQGSSRAELRVFRAGSSEGRLPVSSNLRKQKSLTNLSVLTDTEKKMHLYEPKWCDDMAKPGAGYVKGSKSKEGSGGAPLTRNLSKSEHSLFQGKLAPGTPTGPPKPFSPLAAPSNLGKPSRIPRGPYAEVKPISKAPEAAEDSKSDDEILSSKAKANNKKQAGTPGAPTGKGHGDEENKPYLKVDPELVVTVLGDLEQLLFSQMLDPESQRKRTVQNVLDLRQNLEDTMSSLRGSQLSHSCLENNVCYDSDETNPRSVSSMSNRSSPLSWRYGQSSPRLQAGDAPSSAGGYHSQSTQYASHTMPMRSPSRLNLKSGYMSDSDLLSKSLHDDDDDDDLANGCSNQCDEIGDVGWRMSGRVLNGKMLQLPAQRVGRTMHFHSRQQFDLYSQLIENLPHVLGHETVHWDESSSISSGLSDASDNLSSEEFNASSSLNSLPTTPIGSRRNSAIVLRTDAEKRSLVESGLSWYSEDGKPHRKMDSSGGYDTGSLKTESSSKWRKVRPETSSEEMAKGELKKPQSLGQPNVLKKGKNPPVGVTSPITHTSQSMLKVAAPKSDHKAVDKAKMAVKASGLQRSCSDAGKDRGESRKPPSGLARPSAGTSFGYKKPPLATGTATVMTAGGTAISSGSATVGKTPKTSGIPVKPMSGSGGGGSGGRKTSLDVSNCTEGFLSPNARTNIQYRSLPRPAKSSAMSLTGRASSRPVSSSIDASLLSLKPSGGSSRLKEPGITKSSGRASMGPVNQTDREKEKEKAKAKAVASDSECGPMKSGPPAPQTPQEPSSKLQGLRQSSGSKFSELSSPTTHRVLSSKSLGKPPSLAHLDKVNSNSLDSGMSAQDHPPSVSAFSKMQEMQGSGSPCLTPSPAPVLNINSTSCFSDQALSLSSSPLLYPKLSGLHRSMESLPLHMSVPSGPSFSGTDSRDKEEDRSATGWSGSTRASLTESSQRDRNTLPKKGLSSRYNSCQPEEDGKELKKGCRGRYVFSFSHTIVSLTESECALQLPSPSSVSLSSTGKAPFTNVVSPSPTSAPRMTRSNSIPTHDAAFELYGGSQMGSTLSLADRPKGMIRSGSFRDPVDDVHGSVLSLASSASSNYSSAEERMQGEQIRKLRRELESSQEKVANLTTQLSANANLVAAFEQSLAFMTSRLQSLSVSAEQKDTELLDLRETIEMLKTKNSEAQAVIHGALNNPDITPKELRIKRQNSSESISSLNSITSHSSIGSCKDADAKKKKKKSWVFELRTSFNKAFSIKKGPKSATSYSDIEEIATPDSSAPSSPKLVHEGAENTALSLTSSTSTSSSVQLLIVNLFFVIRIFEGNEEPENEEKVVSELRSELWEKEMKLTDIRLEALSSAHQLEQLREAMNNMQMTVENLKAENDQLKTGTTAPSSAPPSSISQPQSLTALLTSSSPRQSMAMSLTQSFSLSLSECNEPDLSPMDAMSTSSQKDEQRLRVVVCVPDLRVFKDEVKQQDFFIGSVKINAKTDWTMLDKAVIQAFKDYITVVDPASSLGLSVDSIYSYSINNGKRILGTETPEVLPSRCMSKGVNNISVTLKGLKEKCVDSLVFETLIPKPMMQHYISLLLKHRRLILSGPSGTGKTYLTSRLAEYLVDRSGREVTEGITVTYNMHQQSCKDLQLYLSNLANQIDRETSSGDVPLVIILDDLSDACSISELVNGALTCKYHKCPYIIGTTNQPVKMTPNHGLHLSFRMVTFSNNVEPANGFLVRYLHRKLMESENESSICSEELMRVLDWVPKLWYHLHTFLEKHSTSDFLIGPCFFLSCPVTVEEFRSWFIDLWNHSIIPYLQEGAKDGIKVHGHKAVWEDPVEWVRGTLPWPSAQQDQAKLFHLPPPSVGPVSTGQVAEERVSKETTPSSLESDPLMAMLLKLQEAANYIESPDRETAVEPNLQSTL